MRSSIPQVLMKLEESEVRLCVVEKGQEILRAILPTAPVDEEETPYRMLLSALSRCLQSPLHVVLDAADPDDGFVLGLVGASGTGSRTEDFEIAPVGRLEFSLIEEDFRDVHALAAFAREEGLP